MAVQIRVRCRPVQAEATVYVAGEREQELQEEPRQLVCVLHEEATGLLSGTGQTS